MGSPRRDAILDAIVVEVYGRGFAGASVGSVVARAGISRRTFYEAFEGREDCFLAALDDGVEQLRGLIAEAFDREQSRLDGMRGALAAVLGFFDAGPALAHVLLIESISAGAWARERRECHLAALTSLVEGLCGVPAGSQVQPLAGAGAMASLLGVLQSRLVLRRREPLVTLLGPLMGLATAPYLDRAGVAREIELGDVMARDLLAARGTEPPLRHPADDVEIPGLLLDPRARRARACLLYLVEQGGQGFSPSNREIAQAIGIAGDTQISTLLARLHGAGLLVRERGRPGGVNAWSASEVGVRVARALAGAQGVEGHGGDAGSRNTPQLVTVNENGLHTAERSRKLV